LTFSGKTNFGGYKMRTHSFFVNPTWILRVLLFSTIWMPSEQLLAQCIPTLTCPDEVCKGTPLIVSGTTSSSYLNAQVRVFISTTLCGTELTGDSKCAENGIWNNATISTTGLTPGTYYYVNAYIPASTGACGYVGTGCGCLNGNFKQIYVKPSCTSPTNLTATPSSICVGQQVILVVTPTSPGTDCTWKWYTGSCGGTFF
jgi:hypothetical protein